MQTDPPEMWKRTEITRRKLLQMTAGMATLEGVVDVAKGWSVWAFNDPNE